MPKEPTGKYFGEKPIIPWILEEERSIKDWYFEGNALVIEPDKANFERLVCTYRYSITSLYYWRICCVLEVVRQDQMGPDAEKLFRQLKRLECELTWKGILKKRPFFEPYKALKLLVSRLPDIQPDTALAGRLGTDDLLTRHLKSAKPDSMVFYLASTYQLSYEDEDEFMEDVVEFYRKPQGITWNVALYKGISRNPGVRGLVTNLYDALDRSVGIVKQVTRPIAKECGFDIL